MLGQRQRSGVIKGKMQKVTIEGSGLTWRLGTGQFHDGRPLRNAGVLHDGRALHNAGVLHDGRALHDGGALFRHPGRSDRFWSALVLHRFV